MNPIKIGTWVKTKLGKFFIQATPNGIVSVSRAAKKNFKNKNEISGEKPAPKALRHLQRASKKLVAYGQGQRIRFDDLKFDLQGYSDFEQKVFRNLNKVKYGATRSYADLAAKAGSPRASRAVGSVMRKNRIPILLPCHRIIESSGGLGGYSGGLSFKKRLLAMEKE